MDTPAAEVAIDEDLVHELLLEQHPDLADRQLRLVANGWDNAILRLGDDLAVRLPRREPGAVLAQNEQRWLPEIAARVSTSVPAPVRLGVPSALFRWHWSVTPWFEGVPASMTPQSTLGAVADELARFVRELHVAAPPDAPSNPVRGTPLAARAEAMAERLGSGRVDRAPEVEDLWRRTLAAPVWGGGDVWVHGDLHPANILVAGAKLAAVIDFGDICAGDPATDLASAWLVFDRAGRRRFRDALDYDDDTWTRASGWALLLGTAIVLNSADNPAMFAIGSRGLDQVLAD